MGKAAKFALRGWHMAGGGGERHELGLQGRTLPCSAASHKKKEEEAFMHHWHIEFLRRHHHWRYT